MDSCNTLCFLKRRAPIAPRRSRSPNFLKGLRHRNQYRSRSPKRPKGAKTAVETDHKTRPNGHTDANKSPTLERCGGQTPAMDDYLTLTQLEDIWHQQDCYRGIVKTPQLVNEKPFEFSTGTKHDDSTWPVQSFWSKPRDEQQLSHLAHQTSHATIDGVVHPALRAMPHFSQETKPEKPRPMQPSRLVIPVPTTYFTYGRT